MNPSRVDSVVDLTYGLLIAVAIGLILVVGDAVGLAFGLGVLVSYVLHVVWKMARFDPQWMTRAVEERIEETVGETVDGAIDEQVEETLRETVEETVDEQVEETVSETVGETIDEKIEASVDETVERREETGGEDDEVDEDA